MEEHNENNYKELYEKILIENNILHLCTFKTPTYKCAIYNSLIFLFC